MFCPVKVRGFVFRVCVVMPVYESVVFCISKVLVSTAKSMARPSMLRVSLVSGFTESASLSFPVHSKVFSLMIRLIAPPFILRVLLERLVPK